MVLLELLLHEKEAAPPRVDLAVRQHALRAGDLVDEGRALPQSASRSRRPRPPIPRWCWAAGRSDLPAEIRQASRC
jgi:hypothetical protein